MSTSLSRRASRCLLSGSFLRYDNCFLCHDEHLRWDNDFACRENQNSNIQHFLFSSILPSFCLIFIQNLQNTSKWGIREFFRDIGVNLALKLYKTHEKYTKNANKINMYQTPSNLAFCLSPSKRLTQNNTKIENDMN